MLHHNHWRKAQGLPPLPSRRPQPRAGQAQSSATDGCGVASTDNDVVSEGSGIDRVLAELAVDDQESASSGQEDELLPNDDEQDIADEPRAGLGMQAVQRQPSTYHGGTPDDTIAGQHPYLEYISPFPFAEPLAKDKVAPAVAAWQLFSVFLWPCISLRCCVEGLPLMANGAQVWSVGCPLCHYVCLNRKRSGSINNLNMHVKIVHEKIADFACPHCDYKSGKKGNVDRHMKQVH